MKCNKFLNLETTPAVMVSRQVPHTCGISACSLVMQTQLIVTSPICFFKFFCNRTWAVSVFSQVIP